MLSDAFLASLEHPSYYVMAQKKSQAFAHTNLKIVQDVVLERATSLHSLRSVQRSPKSRKRYLEIRLLLAAIMFKAL